MKIREGFAQNKVDEHPSDEALETLSELAQKLLAEVEFLQEAKYENELQSFADEKAFPALQKKIDFYNEIQRFEIYLIKQALNFTNGCQKCAARLLNLKVTTLNTKIKQFGIQLVTTVGSGTAHPFKHEHAVENISL